MTRRTFDVPQALRDAQRLLSPGAYKGADAHSDQWRLDRARWQYQYGVKKLAISELADINAVRAVWRHEGKENNDELPETVLSLPVGEQETLGRRTNDTWTPLLIVDRGLTNVVARIEAGEVAYDELSKRLRRRIERIVRG
jgi:hypothetical protein